MIGLNDEDVIGLIRAVARISNERAELEQQAGAAVNAARWLVAERDSQLAERDQQIRSLLSDDTED